MAGRHHIFRPHRRAAVLFGEPARKRIAFARRRGQFPIMASVGHRLFRRRYRSAVHVEGHGVFVRRPVRVERVFIRSCHHGFLRHLCAAILFGEPARKRISFARQRGQFPVGASVGHRLFRRRYRSAVHVEGHGAGLRRPVRVERVVSRGCHRGYRRHLCADILFGEPARKRIAFARQRGQFPVGASVGHRLFRRRYRSAVRVEGHGVFVRRPLRVERVAGRHHISLLHLRAAVRVGEPARKRISIARRRRQFPINVAMG